MRFFVLFLLSAIVVIPTSIHAAEIMVASFNIKFVGHFKDKQNEALASLMEPYDIVVVQELISPPVDGTFPDNTAYSADADATEFFDAMASLGFSYILSEEDTGKSATIHKNTTSTEWYVAFYKPSVVEQDLTIPHGFLDADRSANDVYDRVPYAFSFRTKDKTMDFVLISVHLTADASESDRRAGELTAINNWINQQRAGSVEQDYLIVGDMNLEDCDEVLEVLRPDQSTLNYQCVGTNLRKTKPFDHVFYYLDHDTEIDYWHLWTIDLVEAMEDAWPYDDPYPGDLDTHTVGDFAVYYSDHHPIIFSMSAYDDDDTE